jgi:hypothetical protein
MGKDWGRANLLGQRFGRLTVWLLTDRRIGGHAVWECRCDCGGTTEATTHNLRSGNTMSCGCVQLAQTFALHGKSGPIAVVNQPALRASKLASGMTYAQIAAASGVRPCRLGRIVRGEVTHVPVVELRRIASAIGANAQQLSPRSEW